MIFKWDKVYIKWMAHRSANIWFSPIQQWSPVGISSQTFRSSISVVLYSVFFSSICSSTHMAIHKSGWVKTTGRGPHSNIKHTFRKCCYRLRVPGQRYLSESPLSSHILTGLLQTVHLNTTKLKFRSLLKCKNPHLPVGGEGDSWLVLEWTPIGLKSPSPFHGTSLSAFL